MSEAIILAIIAGAGGVGGTIAAAVKILYSDNRASWKHRAESAERREHELKSELLPAVQELVGSVGKLSEGRDKEREFYRSIAPSIRRVDRLVTDHLGTDTDARSRERSLETEDERY